jgi:DNA-directed RNA polymerase subunit RPC12/RpoP
MVDVTILCDACGGMVGGAAKCGLKCQIYFCFVCSWQLMNSQNKFPVECPMCVEKLVYNE